MAIYMVMLICVMNHAAFAGSRVVISLYALKLGADQMTIGVLVALYAICPMLLAVWVGKLADRIGPRLPILVGTAGVGAALLLTPLFPFLATLFVAALLIGTSFHFFFVTVTGMTGAIDGPEQRVRNYAMVSLGFSGAAFLGPMAAGFSIDHLGHLPAFLVLAAFTLVPLVLVCFRPDFLPAAAKRQKAEEKRNILDLWRIPALRNVFITSGFIASGFDLFQFYLPIYGHAVGLSASAIGVVMGFFALATFLIRVALPRLVKGSSEAEILTYAILFAAFSSLLFPFFRSAYALAAVAFLLGLGLGCGQPMSLSLMYSLSPAGRVSEAAGLRVMANNFTHLVIPLCFGAIGSAFGFFPVFFSNAAMLTAGGLLMRSQRGEVPPLSPPAA